MPSAEEITQRLKEAADAVDRANLADDLRPIAFARALDSVGLPEAQWFSSEADPKSVPDSAGGLSSHTPPSAGLVARIAARLQVDIDLLRDIYEEADEQVRLIIGPGMLPEPDRKAAAMRHVSLLTAVGRQAAETEQFTAFKLMRDECEELGVLDSANFATEVGKLGFRTQGGRNTREGKANRRHYEEAAALIQTIVEPGS